MGQLWKKLKIPYFFQILILILYLQKGSVLFSKKILFKRRQNFLPLKGAAIAPPFISKFAPEGMEFDFEGKCFLENLFSILFPLSTSLNGKKEEFLLHEISVARTINCIQHSRISFTIFPIAHLLSWSCCMSSIFSLLSCVDFPLSVLAAVVLQMFKEFNVGRALLSASFLQ